MHCINDCILYRIKMARSKNRQKINFPVTLVSLVMYFLSVQDDAFSACIHSVGGWVSVECREAVSLLKIAIIVMASFRDICTTHKTPTASLITPCCCEPNLSMGFRVSCD